MGLVHAPFVDSRRQSLNRYLKVGLTGSWSRAWS